MSKSKRYYLFTSPPHEIVRLDFSPKEIEKFRELWSSGVTHLEICETLGIEENTLGLIIMDQSLAGAIKDRVGGIFGRVTI